MFNGIKKFYTKNKKISKIGFIALAICISYIVTYNMPDYFGIEALYSFMNNISISYLAAVIFYVVQVYIPEEDNQKKSLEILKPKFINMVEFIEVAILVCEKYIEIQPKGAQIKWTDENKIYFKYHKKGTEKNESVRCYTKHDMISLQSLLKKLLNEIRDTTVFKYCDYDIVREVTEIEEHSIFETVSLLVRLCDTDISFPAMNAQIKELKKHVNVVKEIYGINWEYELEDIEPGEKVIADIIKGNVEENLKSIDELNRKITKERLKNQISKQAPELVIDDAMLDKMCDQIINKK